jgi:hypothetical protein
MKLLSEPRLAVINCLTGETVTASKWPFIFGSGEACDVVVDDLQAESQHCEIAPVGKKYAIRSLGVAPLRLNGTEVSHGELFRDKDYSLQIGESLFVLRLSKNPDKWTQSVRPSDWFVQHKATGATSGPFAASQIAEQISNGASDLEHIVFLRGTTVGFFQESVASVFETLAAPSKLPTESALPQPDNEEEEDQTGRGQYGSLTCPTCWLKFDPGDVKHVAVHEKLKGDKILGEGEMMRFSANRFADSGVALDPMGIPAIDKACPHCHRKLPPGFIDIKHHIVSIVGAPTSGKSYFLSVFTETIEKTLFQHFNAAFVDADPTANARLTDMRDTLFGASTPEQAKLAKTDLEGDMYDEVVRFGRTVKLPKPFVFNIQPTQDTQASRAFIFYDNAGENFQPGINQTTQPGAQHLAASSGIVFLFDPAYSREFRRRLPDHHDPQLKVVGHADIQATILSQANVLVRAITGIDTRAKLDTPVAVVVGKLDLWRELIPADDLAYPILDGSLDLRAIDENSSTVRRLMLEVCPSVVAGAEAMSNNVKYFPVSSFGCSPEILGHDDKGIPILGPDPAKISPILVEMPILWLLSRIEPHLVPTSS